MQERETGSSGALTTPGGGAFVVEVHVVLRRCHWAAELRLGVLLTLAMPRQRPAGPCSARACPAVAQVPLPANILLPTSPQGQLSALAR